MSFCKPLRPWLTATICALVLCSQGDTTSVEAFSPLKLERYVHTWALNDKREELTVGDNQLCCVATNF